MANEDINKIGEYTEEIVDTLRQNTEEVKENLATNYYNKKEVQQLIQGGLTTTMVDELPEEGKTGIVYLVPVDPELGNPNNIYKEWIWLKKDDVVGYWESLGSTEFNVTNYYDKTESDKLLDTKLDAQHVPSKTSELENDTHYLSIQIVEALPEVGEEDVLYLVPETEYATENNNYNEYVWVNAQYEAV